MQYGSNVISKRETFGGLLWGSYELCVVVAVVVLNLNYLVTFQINIVGNKHGATKYYVCEYA